ncbi:MAG: DUF2461 domain-containing protein [Bacteroidaceae bacterium]|nr:DUF2461 domain-containing protein [Bacteroidaceae bacterium]
MERKGLIQFLSELREHNNREWFRDNKHRYDALREVFVADVERLISLLACQDDELRGVQVQDCIYRIYRDIRFSADKTPYKTYFSAYIARGGRKSPRAGYYVHVEPGNVALSGGIWCPDSRLIKALRQAIYDNLDEWQSIVENPVFLKQYPQFVGDTLKTVPRGFPREGSHVEWLKRKDYTVWGNVGDNFIDNPDWVEVAAQKLLLIKPMNDFLNYTVDELSY